MSAIDFSDKQKEVWANSVEKHHRWNILTGATRSGKTYLHYYVIPKRIRAAGEGLVVFIGYTQGTLESNIFSPLRDIWGDKFVSGIKSGKNTITLFGRECYAFGADKITQVNRLRGSSIVYCYGDEIATWSKPVFDMLKSRLDKEDSCFDGTCNPENPKHWLKEFLDTPNLDIYEMPFKIDDNPFLPPSFVENLKKEYAGTVYYDRYILGKWKAAEGAIYKLFANNPSKYEITAADVPRLIEVNIGVDFGGNKSATTFVAVGFTEGYGDVIALDEERRDAAVDDPEKMNAAFVEFCARVKSEYSITYKVYCDSEDQYLKKGLAIAARRAGIGVNVANARKHKIISRIHLVTGLMSQGRFYVLEHCENVKNALANAVYDDKKIEDTRLDNGSYDVDTLDALEYAIENDMNELGMGYLIR